MNRRFSKALALLMAVSLCATPAFAASVTYDVNGGTGTAPTDATTDYDSNKPATAKDGTGLTKKGYKFLGWSTDKKATTAEFAAGAEITFKDSGDDKTLYAVWQEETSTEATVTAIAVKTQPTNLEYTEGDELDLTGLEVTLTMSDNTEKVVALKDFETNQITATPADKTVLKTTDTTVTLKVDGVNTPATITIKVNALPPVSKDDIVIDDSIASAGVSQETTDIDTKLEIGEKVKIEAATPENEQSAATKIDKVSTAIENLGTEDATPEKVKAALEDEFIVVGTLPTIKQIKKTTFALNIKIEKDGQEVKNDSRNVKVDIQVPSVFKTPIEKLRLLAIHYHGTGKPRIFKTEIDPKTRKVSFMLNGLSDVVLVEYEEDETPQEPDNKPSTSDNRYVSYNPGGSSGGSGGGGGGSSSSNRGATSMFNSLTNTINGILKSQLSKGTVGAASAVTSTATAPVSTPATQAAATRAISQAVSKARANGSNSAEAIMQNVSVVSASILESIASEARKSGVNAYLSVDTMKNGIVDVRVRIPVSAASRLGRDVNMASVDNTAVKARFNRYYSNRLDVVALAQNGSFGVPASVAARLALGNANAADLHFYSFNAATNSYQEMVQTGAFIDVNGYLHFNTELGGYIIVSVGSLELK